jgi:hypothetical protein
MTERETLLAEIDFLQTAENLMRNPLGIIGTEIAERQARLAELDASDPLLIEAQEIADRRWVYGASNLVSIRADDYRSDLVAALHRGMELAKAPPTGSVMGEAEIEALARKWEDAPNAAGGRLSRRDVCINAIRETISCVQPRWPSEGELREMADDCGYQTSVGVRYDRDCCIEMARRIRAYQQGEQA